MTKALSFSFFIIRAFGLFRHSTFVLLHFQRLPRSEKFQKLG